MTKRQGVDLVDVFERLSLKRLSVVKSSDRVNSHKFRRERISLENPLAKALNRSKLSDLLRKAVPWNETRDQTRPDFRRFSASLYTCFTTLNTATLPDSMVGRLRCAQGARPEPNSYRWLNLQVPSYDSSRSYLLLWTAEIEIGTQPVILWYFPPVISSAGCPSSLWEQFCWSRLGGPAWSSPIQASSTCAGYFSRCVQWLQQAHQELLGRRHALLRFEFVKPLHMKEMITWNSSRH